MTTILVIWIHRYYMSYKKYSNAVDDLIIRFSNAKLKKDLSKIKCEPEKVKLLFLDFLYNLRSRLFIFAERRFH